MDRRAALAALWASVAAAGCGGGGGGSPAPVQPAAEVNAAPAPSPTPAPPAPTPAPTPPPPPPPANIATWGDSLTADYAADLGLLMPERTVFRGGVGAQTSTQIAARQGGVVPLLRLAGDILPATGPVQIVSQSVAMQNNQGPGPITGSLAGVPGTVVRNADGTFTFTRTTPGLAISTDVLGERFIVDTFGRRAWPTVFWYGRNNAGARAQVLADLAASVAFLEPGTPFLVISVLNAGNEIAGTGAYNTIRALNSDLAAAYPGNFFDVRAALVASFDPANPQDVIDNANDVPPSSLRRDALHMNAAGKVRLATLVKQQIEARGW